MEATKELSEEPILEEQEDKLVIFAWSGDLDRMWPTLILATTSAAMGQETTVFFTFWGLFPLVKNDVRITGENWMQKMMSVVNRGGTEHLRLSKMNFAGAGPRMMKKLAREHKVASPTELLEMARALMETQGLKRDAVAHWVLHSAGRRVLDRARELLDLTDAQMSYARGVLREYGNMSSATILFVLERLLSAGVAVPGDWGVMIGLGPGFAAEGALLRW